LQEYLPVSDHYSCAGDSSNNSNRDTARFGADKKHEEDHQKQRDLPCDLPCAALLAGIQPVRPRAQRTSP